MSIRIQNDPAASSAHLTSRTESAAQPHAASGSSGRRQAEVRDVVSVSTLSEQIAAVGEAHEAAQAVRVQQLAALYQSGRYEVDAESLSKAIVDRAIGVDSEF